MPLVIDCAAARRGCSPKDAVDTLHQAGYYGVNTGTPYAKTKFTQNTRWTFGNHSIGYSWRYIGGTKAEDGTVALDQYKTIKPYNYIDLNLSTTVMKSLKLGLTINNLFDKDPPFIGTGTGPSSPPESTKVSSSSPSSPRARPVPKCRMPRLPEVHPRRRPRRSRHSPPSSPHGEPSRRLHRRRRRSAP